MPAKGTAAWYQMIANMALKAKKTKRCPVCKGKGYISTETGHLIYHPEPCTYCGGTGKVSG